MKYLLLLVVLFAVGTFLYLRLRPYLAVARRVLGYIREVRRLNTGAPRPAPDTMRQRPAAPGAPLVRCATCGAWLPAERAVVFRATKATYCSTACLERAAANTERRKTADGQA
ncbi:MAG TPA: hypothetical protein VF546_23365 [Pyrinomonadaceae bacterium]|jgi:hypothetical protein